MITPSNVNQNRTLKWCLCSVGWCVRLCECRNVIGVYYQPNLQYPFGCFAGGHLHCWGRASERSWSWQMFIKHHILISQTIFLNDLKGLHQPKFLPLWTFKACWTHLCILGSYSILNYFLFLNSTHVRTYCTLIAYFNHCPNLIPAISMI